MFAAWQRHHSGHRGSNSFSSYCKCSMATLKPQSNGPLYSNTVIGMLVIDGWAVTARYSEEGPGWGCSPPTASVPITILLYNGLLLCSFNVPIKGLMTSQHMANVNCLVNKLCV